jgi:hypothetical protein
MKKLILLSFLFLIFTPKINSQKIYVDSYSKTTYYIYRFRYEDSSFNLNKLESRIPDDVDFNVRRHVFDLDNMTSTYISNGDSSVLNIKVDHITNTKMVIHILEDGDDYGYVIDLDPSNELFYRYDTQLNKFIELNTFNYVIHRPM